VRIIAVCHFTSEGPVYNCNKSAVQMGPNNCTFPWESTAAPISFPIIEFASRTPAVLYTHLCCIVSGHRLSPLYLQTPPNLVDFSLARSISAACCLESLLRVWKCVSSVAASPVLDLTSCSWRYFVYSGTINMLWLLQSPSRPLSLHYIVNLRKTRHT
jgi:hypothetical protein